MGFVFFSYFLAHLLTTSYRLRDFSFTLVGREIFFSLVCYLIGFLIARSYSTIIRHTGQQDAYKLVKGATIAFLLEFLFSATSVFSTEIMPMHQISKATLLVHFLLVIFLLIGSRLVIKALYYRILSGKMTLKTNVLIYGAGSSGLVTKQTLENEMYSSYNIIGFIDDNTSKVGKSLIGAPIYSPKRALDQDFLLRNGITEVILSIQKLDSQKKREIIDNCLELNLKTKVIPPVERWIQGELSSAQIKSVRIEDVLSREQIKLDSSNIARELSGKVVLVTGAAGSIGSEIVRQVLHFGPAKVVLVDQAESPLYELELDVKTHYLRFFPLIEVVVADVSDRRRMVSVFERFNPQVVFHAAAYKHVPLMEEHPSEAVRVNVVGTFNLASLSIEHQVEKFVMVSTDKAVNPTNVMGATKRVAELIVQSRERSGKMATQFITTRFGNVLGSNGSVIPVFKKQIDEGGPLTITHRDITRYFMTISEACNLVLEAGAMGNGGEIFVFDMGQSVKIIDLAKKMIQLSGLEEGRDIEIVEIGLRPGEKLYEELLATEENTKETHHDKIMIANVAPEPSEQVDRGIKKLMSELQKTGNEKAIVLQIKELVPEFISNNSPFSQLDPSETANS
jgi:FlaA1/EpsC-like NDP-sugar epimerase